MLCTYGESGPFKTISYQLSSIYKMEKPSKEPETKSERVSKLSGMSNGLKRTISGVLLSALFFTIVYVGVPTIYTMYLIVQIKCFDEILKIGYSMKKVQEIPLFRTLNWYFLVVANYFLFGETFISHTQVFIRKYYVLEALASYHRFISFCLYFLGLICFMTILRKKLIRQQFSLLSWTHFLLMIISVQTYMIIQVMFEGIIWLVVSLWLVILNDIFAYLFGKYFGKTPLISLSPKKTVEGFVMGGLSTFVLGVLISYLFCHFKYFVCPVKYEEINGEIVHFSNCTPSDLFQPIPYQIFNTGISLNYYPFMKHSLYLSIFASIIAPFGGFCASGFKRAVNVKDFSDTFPGHGGFVDRFDCQFLMMTFANVYIMTFVEHSDVDEIFRKILTLTDAQQLEFYSLLKHSLGEQLVGAVK
ncbi:unnamed protein product [Phyllotreta striolata]|uniref:Phosphatidate cytidylyltransferase n=1 Tax=Phyllotreta striolata TaxID=444603 RepID=A0A9N9XRJ9_PHYSR|nr:unnamed protein product [Phyllotreta striolata]